MKQEDKELLLKDICARLPYGVIVLEDIDKTFDGGCVSELVTITEIKGEKMFLTKNSLTPVTIEEIRPYLRPMSSMTEEECKTLGNIPATLENKLIEVLPNIPYYIEVAVPDQIDWLNKNGFDYRGLIEKNLAIEVTKENNPYK